MWHLGEDLNHFLPLLLLVSDLRFSFKPSKIFVSFQPFPFNPNMKNPQHENGKPATSVSKKAVQNPKAGDGGIGQPHETWYYSSNHVMINRERMMRGIPPLMRSTVIDEVARNIAVAAATEMKSSEVTNNKEFLELKCDGTILQGTSIRAIHNKTMRTSCSKGRDRILRESYQQFGIGTYKSRNGVLFVVQIFSKTGRIEV